MGITQMIETVLMARQPIFDFNLKVIAYELLYRSCDGSNPMPLLNGDTASSRVILHSYTSVVEKGSVRTLPAFINFTQRMLEGDVLPALSPNEIVIEILEDCEITPALVKSVRRLKKSGYKLALDDFVFSDNHIPLIELVDIIKIDIMALGLDGAKRQIELLSAYNVTLLAEKVETNVEFEECKKLGFKLFQGFFFSKPLLLKGHKSNGSKIVVSQFLAALYNPESSFDDLHEMLSHDPSFSYKLLRLTNSSAFGLKRKISSLKEAMILIGISELKKWATLILMAEDHGKPHELIRKVLITARFCENLSKLRKYSDPSQAFFTGLILNLDCLTNQSLDDIIHEIEIHDEIKDALLKRSGPLGFILNDAESFMQGSWHKNSEVELSFFNSCYHESLKWCNESIKLMGFD